MAAAAGLDDLDRVGTAQHLDALGEVDRSGVVPEIGPKILQGPWTTVSAGRWRRREAMPVLEGRALVWGVRHVSRGLSEFGKRVLFLTDGLSEVLALEKGFPEDKHVADSEGLALTEKENAEDLYQRVYHAALAEFRSIAVTLGLRLGTAADYDGVALERAHRPLFDSGGVQEGSRLAANQCAARLVAVTFVSCLQLAGLTSPAGRQVAPPSRAAGHDARPLVLFPMEKKTSGISGTCNASIVGALPFYHFIGSMLKLPKSNVGERELAAQARHMLRVQACRAAGQQLRFEGPPGLYQLRDSGASADFARGRRSLAEVPARGRWATDSSALPAFAARAGGAVALEVFSGSGNLSRAWRRRQQALGFAVFEWDLRWGDEYDLTRRRVQRSVRGWVNNGLVAAVWMGTPCHSWSRARGIRPGPPPLRSDVHVMGLPDLAPRSAEKVRVGNALMKFSASLFALRQAVRVPVATENPHLSRIWLTPQFKGLLRKCRTVVLDFCQFGQSCRKRTRIVYDHVDLQPFGRLCNGPRGICSRTGRPHDQLQGTNSDGIFLTLLAEAYPADLCASIVRCFQFALAEKQSQRVQKLWRG
ncbi:unnamed protein product [Prorocentrum cordatum]|uniref:Uncharacterized protein n=1 Tax=Prorocentrum cordatum TaxID=2364126 RepID=A0ABN9Q6D8_9DINO|nr:unnamed protein product [Polarella glacialis]